MITKPEFYLVFDLETLGLYPETHQIAEFGGVLLDGETLEEVSFYQSYFIPKEPIVFEQKALDVNNLTIDFLKNNGKPGKEVCKEIAIWLARHSSKNMNIHTICNNKVFDLSFLEKEFREHRIQFPVHYANKFDIKDQCRSYGLRLEKISLKTMCEYFGIPYENAHGALQDARMTAKVFCKLEKIRERVQKNLYTM
jgi:DNA polymerase-3 subunit alpha (Gram-positive type)